MSLEAFRTEARSWLDENCPASIRTPMPANEYPGGGKNAKYKNPETKLWLDRMGEKGWVVPTWPKEYGGGGLEAAEARILREEMGRINARPAHVGMGISMIGPALLEYGNDEQKALHLPQIAKGEIWWCQGYRTWPAYKPKQLLTVMITLSTVRKSGLPALIMPIGYFV
jgi:acyl-CoA dehydrogenase